MLHRCSACRQDKPADQFPPWRLQSEKPNVAQWCRECCSVKRKRTLARAPFEVKQRHQAAKDKWLRDFNSKNYTEMVSLQGGESCAICGGPPDSNHGKLHRDHDHDTNERRMLLCGSCNYGLGCFKDDPARLLLAADYLMHYGKEL